MENKNWKTALTAVIMAGTFGAVSLTVQAAPVLPQGVTAGTQSLEGMTQDEALGVFKEQYENQRNRTFYLKLGEECAELSGSELGLIWSNETELKEALEIYTGGSLIRRYMHKKDLGTAPVSLSPVLVSDPERLETVIRERFQGISEEPVNASITRENGQFIVTEGQPGETLDIEATRQALDQALAVSKGADITVQVVMDRREPQIMAEDLSTISDVLGTFTTDFGSSGKARSTNLSVGAAKINGRLLMPGEVISGYECLQPFTTENGYKTAATYENGRVVDSIGGGVCQIATTLYNAALEAELEIVQRQNHSMIVNYVPPSMDAAIAGTVKDIKIKNNYPTPIYIEGYTEGKKLTFAIYGQETRPKNRTVEYVSEVLSTTDPGAPQLIPDAGLAPGAKVRIQSAHVGRKSRLWKVVSEDGKEVERILLNEDTYKASKAIYHIGPEAAQTVIQPSSIAEGGTLQEEALPEPDGDVPQNLPSTAGTGGEQRVNDTALLEE